MRILRPAFSTLILLAWSASAAPAKAAENEDDGHETKQSEFTAVPFAGGDSDVGFGGGFIASWARLAGYDPYLLRVEAATAVTFKRPEDSWAVPYTDAYVLVDAPHVIPDRLRLKLRISYTREQRLPYSGLGNASEPVPEAEDEESRYTRVHPTADLQSELHVTKAFHILMGVNYTPNSIHVNPDSRLAHDMNMGSEAVRRILGNAGDHSVILFSYGVSVDTRDNLVNSRSGFFASARVDLAPGESGAFTHRWARANTSVRGFVPLIAQRLTLAGRVVTDWLFGEAPFYELPRYDATSAIGGASGVRGIPAQRYFGKIKAFGNVELRSELFKVHLLGKETTWGVTGFFDAGRVWADYESHPELDGTALGLKYGTGAGLRLASGKSFVLRFDVAWSRESSPVSAYLLSGHAF